MLTESVNLWYAGVDRTGQYEEAAAIYDTFETLPKEKRAAVLNAGYACFGHAGYAKASMADIAKAAGVSKASLFHYFGTKQNFYAYLYEFGARLVVETLNAGVGEVSDDFFDRIAGTQALKMRVIADYPDMYDFYAVSIHETDPDATAASQGPYNAYIENGYAALFDGVDFSRFKPGVRVEMVMNLITWASEGYIKSVPDCSDGPKMVDEVLRYIDLIKQAVYREEFL